MENPTEMDDLGVLISPLQFLRCLSDMPMSGIPAHGRYSNNLLMKWSQHVYIYIYVCVCMSIYTYMYIYIYLYSFRSYIKIHIYTVYPNAPCMVYLPIFWLLLGLMLIHIMINSASPPLCQRPPWTGPLFLRLGVVGQLRPLPKLLPQAKP